VSTDDKLDEMAALPLYLARIGRLPGTLALNDGTTRDVTFTGEMIVAAVPSEDGRLKINTIRRLSLWTTEPIDELHGQLVIAGPLGQIALALDPATAGDADPFDVHLSYPLLNELEPLCTEFDAHFPQLEALRGRMDWDSLPGQGEGRRGEVRLRLELDQLFVAADGAGLVIALRAESSDQPLLFMLLGAEALAVPFTTPPLAPCIGAPAAAVGTNNYPRYEIRLRFVSHAAPATPQTQVEDIVRRQLAGACEVWWIKGGIKLLPAANVEFPVGAAPSSLSSTQHAAPVTAADPMNSQVEVYLVDALESMEPLTGTVIKIGGIAYNCRTQQAYIILTLREARHNPFLLAHELGHVLGVTHPTGSGLSGTCASIPAGEGCTVMVPDSPDSSRNTQFNLTQVAPALPLAGVMTALPGSACGWSPDPAQGFFHIVRDFPLDNGTVSSSPAPPHPNHYAYSDVWNAPYALSGQGASTYADAAATELFREDFTPRHFTPTWTGPNLMYVRAHTCQQLSAPVKLHLFLAVPGVSSEPLVRLTPSTGLNFGGLNQPAPGRYPNGAKVNAQSWSVPSGYPAHCCVFAVAVSAAEPGSTVQGIVNGFPVGGVGPIAGTSFFTFAPLLASSNDVAQRNLQITAVPQLSRLIALPWLMMSNPFADAGLATITIEVPAESGLGQLVLEVDDKPFHSWKPDGIERIVVSEQLRPGVDLPLRLAVALGGPLPEEGLPITIGFQIGDEQVAGYCHMLIRGTDEDLMQRALDTLQGALRDVASAFKLVEAQALASSVRRMVRQRYKRESTQLAARRKLALRLVEVAGAVSTDQRPAALIVQRRLEELADTLLSSARARDHGGLAARVLELADRIQERSGRLARAVR